MRRRLLWFDARIDFILKLEITMQKRYMLRRHIVSAWHKTVEEAYSERLINSERSLQHYFCSKLLAEFSDEEVKRLIFVEPCFTCPTTGKRRSPDVIVCHSRQIIGAIELKFLPRGRPSFEKDLDTLRWLGTVGGAVSLVNERYLGVPRPAHEYTIADDAVLCWAGIYKAPQLALASGPEIETRFLDLHALTSPDTTPKVLPEVDQ